MHRLSLSLLLVVLIGVFGVGVALDELFERYQADTTTPHSEIQSFGQGLADLLDNGGALNDVVDAWPVDSPYSLRLDSIDDSAFPDVLSNQLMSEGVVTLGSEDGLSFHFYLDEQDKVLSIQTSLMEDGNDSTLSWLLTVLFYLATLLLLLLWLRPLLHRHRILRQSTKAFGEGQLDSRIDTRGVSYIQDIEHSFNQMADRIQQLVEDNKMLTSAVSHDLRTPLARLRFGVDTLSNTASEASKTAYLERINDDLKEMESLVESLLRYAQLDNVLEDVDRQDMDIVLLIEECIAQHYDSTIQITLSHNNQTDPLLINGGIEHIATLNQRRFCGHSICR